MRTKNSNMGGSIFTWFLCLTLFATLCSGRFGIPWKRSGNPNGQQTYGHSSPSDYWTNCRSGNRYYQEGEYIWARCFFGGYYWLQCDAGRWRRVTSCGGAYPQYGGNGRGLGPLAYWLLLRSLRMNMPLGMEPPQDPMDPMDPMDGIQ